MATCSYWDDEPLLWKETIQFRKKVSSLHVSFALTSVSVGD
jgi:hypothetical protein